MGTYLPSGCRRGDYFIAGPIFMGCNRLITVKYREIMDYFELFDLLKTKVNYDADQIVLDGKVILRNYSFVSANGSILPGEKVYQCVNHGFTANDSGAFISNLGNPGSILDIHDSLILENKQFKYHLLSPACNNVANDFILMIHGFNEKSWVKYLPWAYTLVEKTGKSVVLFPMAFHMNRAPSVWSEKHAMHGLSESRQAEFPDIVASTFSNVAISTRLYQKPQRFFWSGLQSYYDLIQFLDEIRAGNHPFITRDAGFDLIAYSIGGLLSQILMMTNHRNYFSQSKLCLFCGGIVFNRYSPVSRFILDSEANVALYSYIIEHLENHLKRDEWLRHYLTEQHPEGESFRAMLNYNLLRTEREAMLVKISDRVFALALERDVVAPPYEVINTLNGIRRDIPIDVEVMDFSYPYSHENPFPLGKEYREAVSAGFNLVFERLARFLKN